MKLRYREVLDKYNTNNADVLSYEEAKLLWLNASDIIPDLESCVRTLEKSKTQLTNLGMYVSTEYVNAALLDTQTKLNNAYKQKFDADVRMDELTEA